MALSWVHKVTKAPEMLKNYFKTAWRNLVKNKVYSIINVAGLSIGLAVCMLITLFVKDEFSFDQFQKHKNEIYRLVINEITGDNQEYKYGVTGMIHGIAFQKQIPDLQNLARISGIKVNIKRGNDIFVQDASYTDSSFFKLFTADFVEGNADNVLSDPYSVVISEDVAKRFFGNKKALGQVLEIEKKDEFKGYTITGVTKNSPQNSSIQIHLLMPFDYQHNDDHSWINFYLNTFFMVKKGADISSIENRINAIYLSQAKTELENAKRDWNYNSKLVFRLQPFLQMHLSREYRAENGLKQSGNALLSYVLSGLALFILFIACINFVNISISHSLQRAKEIGVRKVMGSNRGQLIWQFMSESFLLNLGAFILATIWVTMSLPIFNSLNSKSLAFSYLFDFRLICIFLAIFVLTCFLAGFYPSLVLSKFKPAETLYGRFHPAGKNILLKTLIVFQFGLATFFITLTIVQYKQVNLFTTTDLGYDDRNMVIINSGSSKTDKGKLFMEQIRQNKDIVSVAPRNYSTWVTLAIVDGNKQMGPDMNIIDENYVGTLGLKILEGRNFSPAFPADSTLSVLVNEAFVKEAGWKNPIGQNVKVMNRDPYKVIGVIKDYHFSSLYEKVRPQMFTCNNNYGGYGTFYIKLSGDRIPQTLNFLKVKFKETYPFKPYGADFLSDINDMQYEREVQMRQIIFSSALIIIFISCMGMFGLSVLTTEKRRKEIGIRKVLGASLASIAKTISWGFMQLVMLAFIIFAPIAYYTGYKLLENYPYRIHIGIRVFSFSFLILFLLSLLTVSYQSINAAMANPAKSLKSE